MNLSTVESVLLALLVVDAIALTVLVLIQQGKGADVGAAFGSGSASTMFGSLGAATFFTKATAGLAVGFFLITFGLAYVAKERAAAAGTLGIPTVTTEQSGEMPAVSDDEMFETDIPESDIPQTAPVGMSDVPSVDSEIPEDPANDAPDI